MNILGWILFGLIVGALAKLLMPGRDPGGWIVTILLGIAGSFVGGFLGQMLFGTAGDTAGWIGSILGAMVLLLIYRLIVGRRAAV
ncbi:MAG TPA: GlsB/YeaQ/YmgE family stress response membrane protein [Thermoanaerobaculia bacterium]|nr:GlsB/YeaQ/YmgE family stress response membrane protein [Thermoanaerobaculia bacterium]